MVMVKRRLDLVAEITDDGFTPDIIYLDQGHSIKWTWKGCSIPHSIQEVKYEMSKACFKREMDTSGNVKTVSGSYRHDFS
jgi:plastocyanin